MKNFLLCTKNTLDTELYINYFKRFCKNRIDYTISDLNEPFIQLMSEMLQLKPNIVKSFILDEKEISYRIGRVYTKFTNFRHIFENLKSELSDKYNNYYDFNFCQGYNLIVNLTNIKQYNYFYESLENLTVINVSDFRFRVKNSKLINTMKDFEKILEIDDFISLEKSNEC